MAGLQGTQQSARDALTNSFKMTEQIAELNQQALDTVASLVATYMTGIPVMAGGPKVKESIGKDAAAGRISPEQAQELINRVNNAMVDALNVGKSNPVLSHEGVAAAINAAAERGAPLKVKKGDVEVETGDPPENFNLADGGQSSSSAKTPFGWLRQLLGSENAQAASVRKKTKRAKIAFELPANIDDQRLVDKI